MKYCKKCIVSLNTQRMTCPLCGSSLSKSELDTSTEYAPYPGYQPRTYKSGILVKLFLFLSIVGAFVSIVVNAMTFDSSKPTFWSVIVIGCILYAWVLIRNTIIAKINIGRKLLFQTIALPLLLIVIEKMTLTSNWALDYIAPFLTVIATVAILMLVFIRPSKYGEYVIYLLMMNMLGVVPIALFYMGIIMILWPSVIAASLSFLTFLGMWVFAGRETKNELKKIFHI